MSFSRTQHNVPAQGSNRTTQSRDEHPNHDALTLLSLVLCCLLIQYLKKLLCLPRCLVILCPPFEIILIFFAVHIDMDSFTRQTVRLLAHRTVESVDIVVVLTPPTTVWGFTMKAVRSLTFRCGEASVQKLVEILRRQELKNKF